jgi:hypothetical protein
MSHFREMLSPQSVNTPLAILSCAGFFLTGGDNGLFRFANLWACASVIVCATLSSGFDYPMNDRLMSAKLGFMSGFLYTTLTEVRMMRPVLPQKYRIGIGSFYMLYHGARYVQEVNYVEDAGED